MTGATVEARDSFERGLTVEQVKLWRLIQDVGRGRYEPPVEHREAFAHLIELAERELGL